MFRNGAFQVEEELQWRPKVKYLLDVSDTLDLECCGWRVQNEVRTVARLRSNGMFQPERRVWNGDGIIWTQNYGDRSVLCSCQEALIRCYFLIAYFLWLSPATFFLFVCVKIVVNCVTSFKICSALVNSSHNFIFVELIFS